jgi:hypothetical protein
MAKKRYAGHPTIRPPQKGLVKLELRRLTLDGLWRLDDGRPAVAFVGRMHGCPDTEGTVWIANCDCAFDDDCPLAQALERAANKYDSATIIRRPQVRGK